MNKQNPLRTIFLGGLIVGTLDGTAAVTHAASRGITPGRVFQFVAAGLLGRPSFEGGAATVLLGVFFQYFIATCVVATYYFASRKFPILIQRAVPCGILYGIAVFFFMNNVVLPLSSAPQGAFSFARLATGIFIHMFFVGLATALVVRFFQQRRSIA